MINCVDKHYAKLIQITISYRILCFWIPVVKTMMKQELECHTPNLRLCTRKTSTTAWRAILCRSLIWQSGLQDRCTCHHFQHSRSCPPLDIKNVTSHGNTLLCFNQKWTWLCMTEMTWIWIIIEIYRQFFGMVFSTYMSDNFLYILFENCFIIYNRLCLYLSDIGKYN